MSNFGLAKGYIQKDYNGKSPYHVDMAFPGDRLCSSKNFCIY